MIADKGTDFRFVAAVSDSRALASSRVAFMPGRMTRFGGGSNVLASGDTLVGLLEEDAGIFSVPSKALSYL